ncbi:MAG TPA: mannose-1-phosphate guanylyltransferase [Kiritimatiellia bacterium]|nr:mannose-1-phosphate guanylyltransferase [Kiritimatiellia bacterium]
MNNDRYYAVILAGGRGERFWPLSTAQKPKQLLNLVGERALIAQAVDRLDGLIPPERILILTNKDLVESTRKAVPELPPQNIVGEPVGRDTAPAVALAAALVKSRCPNGVFCILTADHIIGQLDVFRATLSDALDHASAHDVLITIGIRPTEPATGYGYIHLGGEISAKGSTVIRKAKKFVEKPDLKTAEAYLAGGEYSWNAGMFIWAVSSIESAMKKHCPDISELITTLAAAAGQGKLDKVLDEVFGNVRKISIDYAVMEKADNILVAGGEFAWDDVGSWPAIENHFPKDAYGNTLVGDCQTLESTGNIVYSKDRLTTLLGVQGMIVVQADGVTLICPREKAQEIKKMVVHLRENGSYNEVL